MGSLSFVSGRGITFIIDGPNVEILQDTDLKARIPLIDLLEFAQSHPLKALESAYEKHETKNAP